MLPAGSAPQETSDKSVIELQQFARKNKPNLHILSKLQEEMRRLAEERVGGGPGPGGEAAAPPREGEAAGGDHETESTSDKVRGEPPRPGLRPDGAGTPGREGARVGPRGMSSEAAGRVALPPG